MRLSTAYIPTLKEIPSDAVIPSHQLMLRAGLIRPLAAGVYSYLPLGWKVLKKIMNIVREEMDRIGGQELYLPALNPVEIWDETGRSTSFGDEMFRLKDRKDRDLVLAPTHEEIICDLARRFVRSYKDLPQIWYQIQTKFRDEPRPRSGVIRARQFIMKDSYSLDADEAGLETSYQLHAQAYRKIFSRCGLKFHVVEASSGLMGGKVSQEFMMESPSGEDTLVFCPNCGYAANIEIAVSIPVVFQDKIQELEEVSTPGKKTIEEVSTFLGRPAHQFVKSLLYVADGKFILALVRGDHELNETKLQAYLGVPVRPAHPDEVKACFGVEPGFIGPVHIDPKIKILADIAIQGQHSLITGANKSDTHLLGVEIGRDFSPHAFLDLHRAVSNEMCPKCKSPIRVTNAIELGHIFKLGTKYASSMGAYFLDKSGKQQPIVMGSYGIGIERILACAIEQDHDEKGIVWNPTLAPYQIHLLLLKKDNAELVQFADALYEKLFNANIECIFDDREVSPGFKFKDADLLGIPLQLIIGETWLKERQLELKERATGKVEKISEEEIINTIQKFYGNK